MQLIRKQIYNNKKKTDPDITNIDNIFPLNGLEELCKKLPILETDLNPKNIKNVGNLPLKQFGALFLKEIDHFIKINNICKEEFQLDNNEEKILQIYSHMSRSFKTLDNKNQF